MYGDNMSVITNGSLPTSTLKKKHHHHHHSAEKPPVHTVEDEGQDDYDPAMAGSNIHIGDSRGPEEEEQEEEDVGIPDDFVKLPDDLQQKQLQQNFGGKVHEKGYWKPEGDSLPGSLTPYNLVI